MIFRKKKIETEKKVDYLIERLETVMQNLSALEEKIERNAAETNQKIEMVRDDFVKKGSAGASKVAKLIDEWVNGVDDDGSGL